MDLNTQLTTQRQMADPVADKAIENIVETLGINYLRESMVHFSDYQSVKIEDLPPVLQEFIIHNSQFPPFFNKKEIVRATDFYKKNQQQIGLILALYSLPYCYLGADGARVLCFTERIKNDTYRRLKETGEFLKAVMNYDNWHSGAIFTILAKVRLLHAAIRYFIWKSARWDNSWGQPINQEDMLGTNLAFSLIVLRGMEKLGNTPNTIEKKAYLHTWNCIGILMGINAINLPVNELAAIKIDKTIGQRQFKQSTDGQELTASLMAVIKGFAPNELSGNFLQAQSRFLLGNNYAEMLGIKETNVPESLLKLYNESAAIFGKIF